MKLLDRSVVTQSFAIIEKDHERQKKSLDEDRTSELRRVEALWDRYEQFLSAMPEGIAKKIHEALRIGEIQESAIWSISSLPIDRIQQFLSTLQRNGHKIYIPGEVTADELLLWQSQTQTTSPENLILASPFGAHYNKDKTSSAVWGALLNGDEYQFFAKATPELFAELGVHQKSVYQFTVVPPGQKYKETIQVNAAGRLFTVKLDGAVHYTVYRDDLNSLRPSQEVIDWEKAWDEFSQASTANKRAFLSFFRCSMERGEDIFAPGFLPPPNLANCAIPFQELDGLNGMMNDLNVVLSAPLTETQLRIMKFGDFWKAFNQEDVQRLKVFIAERALDNPNTVTFETSPGM